MTFLKGKHALQSSRPVPSLNDLAMPRVSR